MISLTNALIDRDIDQMKPLSATVVLSLFTPSFRRSTASSGSCYDMLLKDTFKRLIDRFLSKEAFPVSSGLR